jgi:chemotaxis family two-component system response regulator Rcp1
MTTALKTEVGTVDILLVDDNLTDVFFIREALKRCRFSVRLGLAHDGQEALSYLHKEGRFAAMPDPDLVLLDLNLPKKDGWEVLLEMKKDLELNPIPVLIITTSSNEADARRAYRLNADFYIVKPLNMTEFPMLVRSLERFLMGHLHWPDR